MGKDLENIEIRGKVNVERVFSRPSKFETGPIEAGLDFERDRDSFV